MSIIPTRFKHNVNICLQKGQKVFRQKKCLVQVLHDLDLCRLLNININQFDNLKSFKTYLKYMDKSMII